MSGDRVSQSSTFHSLVFICSRHQVHEEKSNIVSTVYVQIFAGCIFRKCPFPDNFRDFNFANGSLCVQEQEQSFSVNGEAEAAKILTWWQSRKTA